MSQERFMDEEKQRFGVAVKAALYKEGKYLILHKSESKNNPSTYDLPGGRLEFGEKPEETLVRELLEETGLEGNIIGIFNTWTSLRDNFQLVGIDFLCKFRSGEEKLSWEHTELLWKSPEEINDDDNFPEWIKKTIIKAEEYRKML